MALIDKANSIKTEGGNMGWHQPGTGGKYLHVLMIDKDLADDLWVRVRPHLPLTIQDDNGVEYKLLYLNSHFRFSKYRKGGIFPLHTDGKNYDNDRMELTNGDSAESLFTLNIFLMTNGMDKA